MPAEQDPAERADKAVEIAEAAARAARRAGDRVREVGKLGEQLRADIEQLRAELSARAQQPQHSALSVLHAWLTSPVVAKILAVGLVLALLLPTTALAVTIAPALVDLLPVLFGAVHATP